MTISDVASPAMTHSMTLSRSNMNPVLPFCPFPHLTGTWEEDKIKRWSFEMMTLHNVVIRTDVKVVVEPGGKTLKVKMYHPDYFYDVSKRYPNASKSWEKTLFKNHPKTKSMLECADELYKSEFFHTEDRIFCEFQLALPFQCREDFSQYHGEDSGFSMLWSKSSNKEHKKKNQFTKSILIDLEAVQQSRFRRKHQEETNIESSSSESGSDSDSDSDSDASMPSRRKSKIKSKKNKKKSAKDKKKELEKEKNDFMNEVSSVRLALEREKQRVRLESEMRTAELERVIEGERHANELKMNTERRANEERINSMQQWVQQQQAQQTAAQQTAAQQQQAQAQQVVIEQQRAATQQAYEAALERQAQSLLEDVSV